MPHLTNEIGIMDHMILEVKSSTSATTQKHVRVMATGPHQQKHAQVRHPNCHICGLSLIWSSMKVHKDSTVHHRTGSQHGSLVWSPTSGLSPDVSLISESVLRRYGTFFSNFWHTFICRKSSHINNSTANTFHKKRQKGQQKHTYIENNNPDHDYCIFHSWLWHGHASSPAEVFCV